MPEARDYSYESKDLSAKYKDLPVFSFPPMGNFRRNSKSCCARVRIGGSHSIHSAQHSELLFDKTLSDVDAHVRSSADVKSNHTTNASSTNSTSNAANAVDASDADSCKHVDDAASAAVDVNDNNDINSLLN